ncbi:SsrA-binding protein SmpB [Mycoplasma sp. ATU-Cv-703]|uniref:SsrA-binding protein SmpB n=1 Tax=Mycoplasma sp. ATU-Cv-703 TaxID=2498595 RepID=UPI000FDDF8B4
MAKVIAKNPLARWNFDLLETYQAGLVLEGWEVKSIRQKKVDLRGAYCLFRKQELYVVNMHVDRYMNAEGNEKRDRKLLLKKQELRKLALSQKMRGLTIVPVTLTLSPRGLVKLTIALGRGKSKFDKREKIKERDQLRQNRSYF